MNLLDAYDVIVSPSITEKSTLVSEHNQVVFNVRRTATKPIIPTYCTDPRLRTKRRILRKD